MRALLQRVKSSSVSVQGKEVGQAGSGLMILLGVTTDDTEKECEFLADKTANLRIFEDENGKMNRSLLDIRGDMLVVSQFTLCADCRKGRRPSFINAARPETAEPLYLHFVEKVRKMGIHAETGVFGADMLVAIENDGPVTIWLDTAEMMPNGKK